MTGTSVGITVWTAVNCDLDKRSHNAVSSSQRDFFEDGREIPDRVGNDVGWFVLRDMFF